MSAEWLDSDALVLRRLALLVDAVACGDQSGVMLAEIRQLEDRFGLSPLARRRLQWELAGAAAVPATPAGVGDDERFLRAVRDD